MYELLVKGGEVIDPAQRIHGCRDIGISGGKIVALAEEISPSEGTKLIEARGKVVAPGLIDLHTHVADAIIPLGTSPDRAGVLRGVTAVCDAGSTGHANFSGFRRHVIPSAKTDVFCFLNVCPVGLAVMPEIRGWRDVNVDDTVRTAWENRDIIRGIKVRAAGALAETLGVKAIELAKKVAVQARIPLMIHIGGGASTTSAELVDALTLKALPLLDRGDVISHVFTGQAGGVIKPDGTVVPELHEAIERGVVLDSAHGKPNLNFAVARQGINRGILPTTISSDLASTNIDGPIFSLLLTMSKFLALGLSLEQIIQMTTINPARVLGEDGLRGTLKPGASADLSILQLAEGDFTFTDGSAGNRIEGKTLLLPYLTLKAGREIAAKPGADREIG